MDKIIEGAIQMANLTWDSYAQLVKEGRPIIIPIGATEQHGYHLPLRTDTLMSEFFSLLVARRIGAIVAPPINYGYKSLPASGGGQDFLGTTSLDGETVISIVRDLIREFFRHGCRKIVLMGGHGENRMFVTEGIDLALREANQPDAKILMVSWVSCLTESDIEDLFPNEFVGWNREHAGIMETSFVLHAYPELVKKDRIGSDEAERNISYSIFPPPPSVYPASGLLTDARPASKEIGERLVKIAEQRLVSILTEEFDLA